MSIGDLNIPLMKFKSHVAGKNADVEIYVDRIEWAKEGRLGTASKLALGYATVGMSLLATGVSGKKDTEVIPIKSISSVVTKKDGIRFTAVRVITTGNTIDFRVGHGDAEGIRSCLIDLMLDKHPTQVAASSPPVPDATIAVTPPQQAPVPATSSVADEIKKLVELRDLGALSDTEFEEQKKRLLD
jgi:hypothetical protein